MEIDVQTLVLIDNSLSVSKANREITKETLKYMFSHTPEGRAYCFAPFSHTLDYAESYTVDYIGLEDMADRLEYVNKEASLTDVLSYVLDEWDKSDFACRDILVLTDGLEEKSDYYEREELFYLLENTSYPVYIVCLDQKDNKDAVKNLSAICRVSEGKLFHTEFEGSDAEVEIKLTDQIMKAMEEYRRNNWEIYSEENKAESESEENVTSDSAGDEIEQEIVMTEQVDIDKDLSDSVTEESVIYEQESDRSGFSPEGYAIFGVSLFLALCGVVLSWGIYIKHRKKIKMEEEEYREKILNMARQNREGLDIGAPVRSKNTDNHQMGETVSLFMREENGTDEGTRLLCEGAWSTDISFEDVSDPSKYYRTSLFDRIVLGRVSSSCDIAFGYDDSVSSRHCEVYIVNERVYVKDIGSSNGTFVNGEKVYTETELRDKDVLKMGSLSVIVRFS